MKSRGKILVVDDDRTITTLLESKLTAHGYEVLVASDGEEALEKCFPFAPDVVILDILMPRMDGYTFVQEFKKSGGSLRETPVIVISSQDSLQSIFEIEGINDYIVKPFNMDHLLRKIDKKMKSKDKKILIVDDEHDIVNTIKNRLTSSGYDVIIAHDGIHGLELAKKETPDLVVLDVMMPKLDGYHVCRMLKFDERYKDINIVLLTALCRKEDHMISKEVRADAYLEKPYDGNTLLHTIKELLWD